MSNNLQGKSQLSRMHELMNSMKHSETIKNPEVPKSLNAVNGKNYGIVRENSYYVIKEHNGTDYSYINGLKNKTDFRYNSYSEALKQMNLMAGSLNEAYGNKEGVDLFQESIGSKKKRYVLKLKKNKVRQEQEIEDVETVSEPTPTTPTAPAPVNRAPRERSKPSNPVPGNTNPSTPKGRQPQASTPPVTDPPIGKAATPPVTKPPIGRSKPGPTSTDDITAPKASKIDFDAEVSSIERELGGGEESPEKEIQSLTGKLGQALRQGEAEQVVDTELTKYVVNSVFSALNIGELTDEDKLDIIKKVKNAGTEEEMPGTPDSPQIGMPGGHPEEEDDTEMEIDGLDTGMGDEELDVSIDDFEDFESEPEVAEDVLYGDGGEEEIGTNELTKSLRDFVIKTVDSYIEPREV